MIWRWTKRLFKAGILVLALAAFVFAGLLVLGRFQPPVSTLMAGRYLLAKPVDRRWVAIETLPPVLFRAVIASEDAGFCRHRGVDWGALREQIEAEDGPSRGASTITMQTVKNLFLWPQRSFIRKGLEIPLALVVDAAWPKQRIMEVYLNIAEWGEGVFGIEAAAQHYFRKPAARLTAREASLLVTALPNPLVRNPRRPGRRHAMLAGINQRRAGLNGRLTGCVRPSGVKETRRAD